MSPTAKTAKPLSEKEAADATVTIAGWIADLNPEDSERYSELWRQYQATQYPTIAALAAYFGIDPNVLPVNNAFFSNGWISFRAKTEATEMTIGGYKDTSPKLNPYPEGLSFELAQAAVRYDQWRLV